LADLEGLTTEIPKLDLRTGGAGKDPAKGKAAVTSQDESVFDLLTRAVGTKADYVMICAGLGGGTGSGAVGPVIDIARKYMEEHGRDPSRVGAIVSLPHHAEGQTPSRNAVRAFNDVYKRNVTPLFIIDNKRINELFQAGVAGIYSLANNQVAKMFHLFNRLAAQKSTVTTFDRADFATLLDSGICVFGASPVAKYESPADISQAVRDQLSQTILADVDLKSGRKAGCIFVGSEEILNQVPMDFFDGGFSMLNRLLADNSVVHRGIYQGAAQDLRCYTMISALPPPAERLRKLAAEGGISGEGVAKHLGVDD
jgi:cell division GTPase FtsZ